MGFDQHNLKDNIRQGSYGFPKTLKLSLEGLAFLNACLQYDTNDRIDWKELTNHPYIAFDPRKDSASEDALFLSYCEDTGSYKSEEEHTKVMRNPYKWMRENQDKVVPLSVRGQVQFDKVYADRLEKF